uniref:Uncharacterized protein LOC102808321 n=1 Tax=Saccoglossus kowalevskii TaxID=10224 RepID=A0ABM0MSA0_SACKO
MKVKYAVQVLSTRVANAVEAFYGNGHQATVTFIRNFDKFFDCLNVRSMEEGKRKKKTNLLPYRSTEDERLKWLNNDFLQYLDDWDRAVDGRHELSKRDRNRMKLSRETLKVASFVAVTKYLLGQPGIERILSEKFNQDPFEAYFGNHRQMKGGNEAPNVPQFCCNANALQLKSLNLLRISGSNVKIQAK